ncbi:MAG: hypothetical protein Q7T99_24500 [Pseudomonas sp.]|nr:hypothetical protein [Pseudomonas sp.]
MPAPTLPPSPAAFSQIPAQTIHKRFSSRPSLFSVVFNTLRDRILERYRTLELDLLTTRLASPTPSGSYTYPLLTNIAIAHVVNPQLLDLRSRRELPFYLTQQIPTTLEPSAPPPIDMQVIAQIIDELPESLYLYFQQALADYWSAIDSHGQSRWQWLGEFLNGQMTATAAGHSGLTDLQRDMLTVTATWPELLERLPRSTPTTYVYFIETTLSKDGKEEHLLTPDLLLVRDKQVLLYSVAGVIEPFDSIDAFGESWGSRMQRQFQCDSVTWRRNEPERNVFERQAGLILNQQLEDLAALSFQGQSEEALTLTLDTLTDPALHFTTVPVPPATQLQTINDQLPEHLAQATADDRFAYLRHSQDMAQVVKQKQGRSFNEGIETIHGFSRDALRKQMQADHADFDPDDVILDFAVAAGYPGGFGFIEHVQMSLTELAVKNLAGKPKGTLKLAAKGTKALPDWLNETYLLGSAGLIQRVDIGTHYPQKIKEMLLSDTAEARRRERLFTHELKVKLPIQALEYAIRQQYGVTITGYRYVKALMGYTPADRVVDGQEIVLRPLGLCRKAGAPPDIVNNFFVIEPRDSHQGPHLLYRPLYDEALHQYSTRQALLDALASPGALQTSVLTWLSDKARAVYDHGGIKEPHIIRFLPGDEFVTREKPAPATLSIDEGAQEWLQSQVNGKLLNHLFGSTARALVDVADRESVSNSESRWAVMMEGAWLLFNTLLLPLARGALMLAGWLLVLVSSLQEDLEGLDSDDPTRRELALIDLLLNTAMVLMHGATPSERAAKPLPKLEEHDHLLHLKPLRRIAGMPAQPGVAQVRQATVALPGEPPAGGHTALDFIRSIASPKAGANLLKALLAVHVPWPSSLPPPEASGRLKGLYRIGDAWHASVGGLLFQVSVVPGFGDVYLVDPQRAHHPGFKLTRNDLGNWRLDRQARLEGGMPRGRITEWKAKRQENLAQLHSEVKRFTQEAVQQSAITKRLYDAALTAEDQMETSMRLVREDWERLRAPQLSPELYFKISERHIQRQQNMKLAQARWRDAAHEYQTKARAFAEECIQVSEKVTKLMSLDRTAAALQDMLNKLTEQNFQYHVSSFTFNSTYISNTFSSKLGENYLELLLRTDVELPEKNTVGYDELINNAKLRWDIFDDQLKSAEQIEVTLENSGPLRERLETYLPGPDDISRANVRWFQLITLNELIIDRTIETDIPAERHFGNGLMDRDAATKILSYHKEVSSVSGYSPSEQIAVLGNVLHELERMENAINSLAEMKSRLLREEYRAPLLELLSEMRSDAEKQVADLIRAEEKIAPLPEPKKAKRPKNANRRVIKTRDNQHLIGELRPSQPDAPGNFVDIKDPITDQPIATYHEHASEGVWVKVVPAAPVAPVEPPKPKVTRSLKKITGNARTLIAQKAGIEHTIRAQQKKLENPSEREAVTPLDWDDMLTQHANKMDALADEIQREHSTASKATELINEYRAESNALKTLAVEARSKGYLKQRPQAFKVAYLWKNKYVDINLLKRRVPLKAGDFLDEYTVRDKRKIAQGKPYEETILWYAHFHYPSVDTPVQQSTFGHLKTVEDRPYTLKELIERARANNREVIYLERAVIKAPLDNDLFFKLAQ